MSDFTDTVVLYEELAVQDVLPVLWRPAAAPPDPQSLAGLSERNYQILRAWDDLEDRGPELSDENSPLGTELQRLDRKLTLLLDLVGQMLCVNQPRPPAVAVCFNALGAEWRLSQPPPEVGAPGTVEIYLRECVAQPLRFAESGNPAVNLCVVPKRAVLFQQQDRFTLSASSGCGPGCLQFHQS